MAKVDKTTLAARQIVKKWITTAELHVARLSLDRDSVSRINAASSIWKAISNGSTDFDRPHEHVKSLAASLKWGQKQSKDFESWHSKGPKDGMKSIARELKLGGKSSTQFVTVEKDLKKPLTEIDNLVKSARDNWRTTKCLLETHLGYMETAQEVWKDVSDNEEAARRSRTKDDDHANAAARIVADWHRSAMRYAKDRRAIEPRQPFVTTRIEWAIDQRSEMPSPKERSDALAALEWSLKREQKHFEAFTDGGSPGPANAMAWIDRKLKLGGKGTTAHIRIAKEQKNGLKDLFKIEAREKTKGTSAFLVLKGRINRLKKLEKLVRGLDR
jgi:hypothetical protein